MTRKATLNKTINIKIVNVVVSGRLNQRLYLSTLAKNCGCFTYDPEIYCGGHLQLKSNLVTLYESGNYIIPGIKSIKDVDIVWEEFSSFMSAYYDNSLFEKPHIRNIVATLTLPNPLNLAKIYDKIAKDGACYEPNVFPAVKWRLTHGTALIFRSGKIVLTGIRSEDEVAEISKFICNNIDFE